MHRYSWTAVALLTTVAHAGTCDFSAVGARTQQLMQAANLTDAGIAVGTTHGIVYKQYFGSGGNASAYADSTIIALASASKMLSGVRVMQLVDRGAINLDTPVSSYLPGFTDADKAQMTMREMFSHTAGYGNDEDSLVLAAKSTLAQDVAYIACCVAQPYPPPGGYFAYGGISMQVGGEVAEVQGNEDWQAGWIHHVGTPLGITSIDWQGLGTTANYRIAGGAQASLPDYAKVLAMLLGDGVGNGRRILSDAAIKTLNHDQTAGAAYGYAPPAANGSTAYGIGAWIEPDVSVSADAPTISSIGAYGFTPWVDFDYGYFGVLMIEQQNASMPSISERAHVALQDMSPLVRAALDASCPLLETYDEIYRDDLEGLR
jgi:CubicO group peptidase (beta-lactamase class C family)